MSSSAVVGGGLLDAARGRAALETLKEYVHLVNGNETNSCARADMMTAIPEWTSWIAAPRS